MSFVRRYEEDTSAPTRRQAGRDLARRTLLPVAGLWVVNVAFGLGVIRPQGETPPEVVVNEELVELRTPVLNTATQVWSNIGGTHFMIGLCLLVVFLVWRITRQWWLAAVPAIALAVQSAMFTTSSFVIGRGRPMVEHLDHSPPTSGFPSGHTGASTAFYLVLVLLAQRLRRPWLRWTVTVLCVIVPPLVGFSRLYRGMHHPSDVVMGLINGVICAVVAWLYLRRAPDEPGGAGLEPEHDVAADADPPRLHPGTSGTARVD